jgi:hypothetical protein
MRVGVDEREVDEVVLTLNVPDHAIAEADHIKLLPVDTSNILHNEAAILQNALKRVGGGFESVFFFVRVEEVENLQTGCIRLPSWRSGCASAPTQIPLEDPTECKCSRRCFHRTKECPRRG